MNLSGFLIKKQDFKNVFIFSILIGIVAGFGFASVGMVLVPFGKTAGKVFLCFIGVGGLFGIIIAWFSREVINGMISIVLGDLEKKVGLSRQSFQSIKTGLFRELDIFDQMFKMVVSILKRVLQISLRLEEASADLDHTAQLSSQVIKEVVDKVDGINKSALENATSLRDTISSLEGSFSLSKEISTKLSVAREDSQGVATIAQSTKDSVKHSVEKMVKIKELTEGSANLINDLNDRSRQIGMILTEIANIAEKTNLLALNAAIEAARAGEQGRGFAVVAEEVRKLARGSAESSKKINNLINDILQKTENAAEMMRVNTTKVYEGLEVVNTVDGSLGGLFELAEKLNNVIKDISDVANRQSKTSDMMYQNVQGISSNTDQISMKIQEVSTTALGKTVIVDQTSYSAKELRTLSDIFQNSLVPFKFSVEGATKRAFVRAETRVACKFKILIAGEMGDSNFGYGDFDLRGTITNLSAGGCVMETGEDIVQGKYVIFAFQIGNQFIQGLQGRLVRLRKTQNQDKLEVFEAIVSFNNISVEHEKVIVNHVIEAQKQFEQQMGIRSEE
ncbi:MAG: PilZ domain-containing protein [Candidatus Riflebacteria bacterium]|nr:PilZ domain-containing protein [Candidatus Riflebacteria bacterium]